MNEQISPKTDTRSGCKKFFIWFFILAFLIGGGWIAWWYYIPFGEDGVKSGYLNTIVYKGNIFKTYEGKLIQDGLKSAGGSMQSNEFEFSIENKSIFDTLRFNSGKRVELQYKEYRGALPWRGNARYVVDKVISISESIPSNQQKMPF